MKTQLLLVAALLVFTAHAVQFNVQVSSTCTNITSGICTAWNQTGSIVEDTGTCFPASTLVRTPEGDIPMERLRLGQRILAFNTATGLQEYSPVVAWLHREPETISKYVRIGNDQVSLVASGMHNIAVGQASEYKFAFAKESLGVTLSSGQKVEFVEEIVEKGVYAPLTAVSNFYVISSGQEILVHSYAHVRNPQYYEDIVAVMFSGYNYLFDSKAESQEKYVHPLASLLIEGFGNLLLDGVKL